MKNYKLKVAELLTISAILTMALAVFSIYLNGYIEGKDTWKVFGIYGTVSAIIGLVWKWFKNYGWKLKVFQHFKSLLNIPPNLNGRWEGEFKRPEHTDSYTFVIEIEQTIDTVVLNTYAGKDGSKSSIYTILTNDLQSTFYLNYFWQAAVIEGESKQIFNGYTMLKLIENEEERKLTGSYFTDREPTQTKGNVTVLWKGKKIKKEF